MAKFCSNCGKEIEDKATICVHCGSKVSTLEEQNEQDLIDKSAKNSLIFGIVSLLTCSIPVLGFIMSVIGICYSTKGLKSEKYKGMAIGGIILSILFLIISLIMFIILIAIILYFSKQSVG